jgi:iron complex outermembrane receptor protein
MTRLSILATTCAFAAAASPAFAQESAPPAETGDSPKPGGIETIVVTAQKRSEDVQSVPLSIVALGADQLEDANVTSVTDLTRVVPNLSFTQIAQASGLAIRIRGFGASSNAAIDPSVAPYVDGVYIARPGVILSSFLDIDGVEVLRGPQGTLFGRNATVGAVSFRTAEPSFAGPSAEVVGEVGSYGHTRLQAIGNLPVSDTFALRVAAMTTGSDGYFENRLDGRTYGGKDSSAIRLSSRWLITPDMSWTLRADYAESDGDAFNYPQVDVGSLSASQLAAFTARLGGNTPTLSLEPSLTMNQLLKDPRLSDTQGGLSSDFSWDLAGDYTLRMINGYRTWRNRQSDGDVAYTPLDLLDRHASFNSISQSHELQLISPEGALLNGKLDFVSGIYFFDEDYKITEVFDLGTDYCALVYGAAPAALANCNAAPLLAASNAAFNQTARSYAGYIQATYAITPALNLVLGARATKDEKSGRFLQVVNNPGANALRAAEATALDYETDRPSFRAGLDWQATDDLMAFLSYSTGYKSGGLNSAPGATPLGQARLFESEVAENVEMGVKSTWLDRRLLLNVTVYNTDLKDFQDRSYNGTSFVVRNAGSVRSRGVELEGQAEPIDGVSLNFGLAYLDATYTSNVAAPNYPACTGAAASCPRTQDLSGRPTPFSPKWSGNLGAEYTTDPFLGGYTAALRADVSFYTRQYSENTLNPQAMIDGQTLLGGRLTFENPDGDLRLAIFAENLTDERYYNLKFAQTLAGPMGVNVPATGATLYRGYQGAPRTFGASLTKVF